MDQMKERPVYVRFEYRNVEDRAATMREGCYVGKDVAYAMIMPPGGNLVVDRVAQEWLDSKRGDPFYRHYVESFNAWKDGEAEPEVGTSVKNWPGASPAQVAACLSANIKTVEDLATAPSSAIMRVGMGGVALQQKAQAWLQSAQDHGKVAEEVVTLRRDKEDLTKRLSELEALVAALQPNKPASRTKTPRVDKEVELG